MFLFLLWHNKYIYTLYSWAFSALLDLIYIWLWITFVKQEIYINVKTYVYGSCAPKSNKWTVCWDPKQFGLLLLLNAPLQEFTAERSKTLCQNARVLLLLFTHSNVRFYNRDAELVLLTHFDVKCGGSCYFQSKLEYLPQGSVGGKEHEQHVHLRDS